MAIIFAAEISKNAVYLKRQVKIGRLTFAGHVLYLKLRARMRVNICA
jgi:hypothetical protein